MRLPWRDWRWPASLGGRLTLLNTALVLSMTAASLLAARLAARLTLYEDADAELRAGAREVVLAIQDLSPNLDALVAEVRRKARGREDRGWFMHLLTADGTTLWKSEHCPDAVATFPPANLDREENIAQVGPYRYVRLQVARPGQPTYHVRVGAYTTGLDDRLTALVRQLAIIGCGLSLVTPLAGWWLARRATRPVADILRIADRLRPSQLGDRLPIRGAHDELDTLASTINRLLDQVAGHVDRQQRFVADAAHELRGPLAAVRSALEVAVAQERPAAAYRATLEDVLEEIRHLSTLANALLTLAEAGDQDLSPVAEPVDLGAVARQSAAMFAGVAEDRGIAIAIDGAGVVVAGAAGQLRQMFGNLLDNAIRFTPPGGVIDVHVARGPDPGMATVTVRDSGTGIPREHIDRVFDRFYKADPARGRRDSRSGGLGLAICKAIAERHGGTIEIASEPGRGTTVTVGLPLAA